MRATRGTCKIAVLNMANFQFPGGTVRLGAGAPEEGLRRHSDLCRFLWHRRREFYPMAQDTCFLSSRVTVFRGPEDDGYPLIQPFQVEVISRAAFPRALLERRSPYGRLHYCEHDDRVRMQG